MSVSPKLLTFLLLTTIFIISTHARESHFFSKVTRHPDPTTNTNAATTNENEEVIDPTFTPETSGGEAGYGLYGHETGLFPPSTTTTTNTNNNVFENPSGFFPQKYESESEKKNYVPELKGLSEFSNNNENYKNDEGAGYYGEVQKQGMSDTRFLENGMYFYDVNTEKNNNNYNNNNNNNNNMNKGGNYNNYGANYMPYNTNYGGNYKENEYYGGNNNEFYNRNSNFNVNDMQGRYVQNQKTRVDDEFEFDP